MVSIVSSAICASQNQSQYLLSLLLLKTAEMNFRLNLTAKSVRSLKWMENLQDWEIWASASWSDTGNQQIES